MAQSFDTSLLNVAYRYAKRSGLSVDQKKLTASLENNPYFPSLYSLQQGFDDIDLNGGAYKINKESIDHVEVPFIAYMRIKGKGNDFVLVTDNNTLDVSYIHKGSKQKKVSKDQFREAFQEIVWKAENKPAIDSSKTASRVRLRIFNVAKSVSTAVVGGLLVYSMWSVNGGAAFYTAMILKMLGCIVSCILLAFENNTAGTMIKQICSVSKYTNCNAVLASKGSKILGISWSEIGSFYFFSGLLLCVSDTIAVSDKLSLLTCGTFIAAPYILYSVVYQWKIVKRWCPLCLCIQAVLLLELFSSLSFRSEISLRSLAAVNLPSIALYILLPPAVWYTVKPALMKATKFSSVSSAYHRLKNHPSVFNGLLSDQERMPEGYEGLGIDIGPKGAPNLIVKVCNPYCGPCAQSHLKLEKLLQAAPTVRMKIIFTAPDQQGDRKADVIKQMLTVAKTRTEFEVRNMLSEWYSSPDKPQDLIRNKYKTVREEENKNGAHLQHMHDWCNRADVTHTPTLFFNGRRMPEYYHTDELIAIFRNM